MNDILAPTPTPTPTYGQRANLAALSTLALIVGGIRDEWPEDSDQYAALDTAVDRVEAAADCLRRGER